MRNISLFFLEHIEGHQGVRARALTYIIRLIFLVKYIADFIRNIIRKLIALVFGRV